MSANKARNTIPELRLRKALWVQGKRGYRLHKKQLPGRPDIAFSKKKVAIFVNGCFWHRCPYCKLKTPGTNRAFWAEKFKKNRARDKKKVAALQKEGWRVYVVWECKLERDQEKTARKIKL